MMELLTFLLQSLGSAALALLALAAASSTKLGEKFLGHVFDRSLAAQKHAQNEQIEELKAKLAPLTDRGVRSNEREFAALTAAWESFVDAWMSTNACAMSFIQHADLSTLTDEEASNVLASDDLSELQKQRVLASTDRNKAYRRFLEINQIMRARGDIFVARSVLRKQGVFIPDDLQNRYKENLDLLAGAQSHRQMEFNGRGSELGETAVNRLLTEGSDLFDRLQAATRTRLLQVELSSVR